MGSGPGGRSRGGAGARRLWRRLDGRPAEASPKPRPTVAARGLANPRQLSIGPDGALYVALAGSGGTDRALHDARQHPQQRVCLGETGPIARVVGGRAVNVVGGLPSVASPGGAAASGPAAAGRTRNPAAARAGEYVRSRQAPCGRAAQTDVRAFHHSAFPPDRLRAARTESISVCVPARDEAATIALVVAPLVALREAGAIDEVLVIDDDSQDATGEIAARLGAEVHRPAGLLAAFGPVLGKGDAMWRALSVARGDIVCFVDGDSEDFGAHFVCGLVGPLVCDASVQFVKGFYRRPFKNGVDDVAPTGGGRVTELTARPLLAAFYPELAGVHQPLAGEIAARRELLERMPFCTGYAVEMGLLLDVFAEVGVEGLAQVDLDARQNRHQPLERLTPMAANVLAAVTSRLRRDGRLRDDGEAPDAFSERPPLVAGRRS